MDNCEFPLINASNDEIKKLLETSKTIAVVGLSSNPSKDSYRIANYMKNHGYKIIPVNPAYEEVLGEKAYPNLKSIPEKIDIVDIFRKPEAIMSVVDEALEISPTAIWMQLGLVNNEAAKKAQNKGVLVIMNKCLKIEHSAYFN